MTIRISMNGLLIASLAVAVYVAPSEARAASEGNPIIGVIVKGGCTPRPNDPCPRSTKPSGKSQAVKGNSAAGSATQPAARGEKAEGAPIGGLVVKGGKNPTK